MLQNLFHVAVLFVFMFFIGYLSQKSKKKRRSFRHYDRLPHIRDVNSPKNLQMADVPELIRPKYIHTHEYELEYVDEGQNKLLLSDGFSVNKDPVVDGRWLLKVAVHDQSTDILNFISLNSDQVILIKDMQAQQTYSGQDEVCAFLKGEFSMQEFDRIYR